MTDKIELIGLTKNELAACLREMGEPAFRVKQIWQWVYFYGKTDFNEMTNLSKALRQKLAERFVLSRPKTVTEQLSSDKTRKWLLEFADGEKIETVYIPEADRGAVCISTQIGCAMGCRFCHTGSQKLTRNLTAGEIVGQFMLARDVYGEWNLDGEKRMLSNIDRDMGVKLAVSLHASNNEQRSEIMPINKKYPLPELMQACHDYQENHGGYITFEYLMLKDFNDTPAHADELAALMKKYKINAKFNLIAFNPWPGCSYQPSSNNRIHAFSQKLQDYGFAAPIRTARGQDILAACGQLRSKKNGEQTGK